MKTCTLAYWHHPLFSSGSSSGGNSKMKAFWEALYAAKAEVVLNGHVHNYEHFAPQRPSGVADPAQGIREFVVGTGGYSLNTFEGKPTVANSKAQNDIASGVLKLTLHPNGYDWEFVPEAGKDFTVLRGFGIEKGHRSLRSRRSNRWPNPTTPNGSPKRKRL